MHGLSSRRHFSKFERIINMNRSTHRRYALEITQSEKNIFQAKEEVDLQ